MEKRSKLLLLLILLQYVAFSQKENIRFDLLSIKNGLSQSSVNDILQDEKGFIWIATQDGLNRYDGYQFRIFYHEPQDSSSLSNNYVYSLAQDTLGNIWGATDIGFSKFDPEIEKFTSFYADPNNPNSIADNRIRSLAFDSKQILWVGTEKEGLFSFNSESGESHRYSSATNSSTNEIMIVFIDHHDQVWVGSEQGGLAKWDQEAKKYTVYNQEDLSGNIVKGIYEDQEHTLWVGTNTGLWYADNKEQQGKRKFKQFVLEKRKQNGKQQTVNTIHQSEDGKLWVGTEGGGLYRVDIEQKTATNYINKKTMPSSLSDNIVQCLYEDAAGLMWIGTNNGLNKFDPKKQSFVHLYAELGEPFGLSDNTVWAILDDGTSLWVGSRLGLNQVNKETGEVMLYDNISKSTLFQGNKAVMLIHQDSKDNIFVGTVDGLYQIEQDLETKKVINFKQINYSSDFFKTGVENKIYRMLEDHQGNLWVGTKKGLARICNEGKRLFLTSLKNNPNSLPNNTIREIFEDSNNTIWVGTEAGLCKVIENSDTVRLKIYRHNEEDTETLSNDLVISIWEGEQDELWIGTYGGGLNKFNTKTETFKAYTEKEGLANNVVYGVLGDDMGRLWLSTNKGISMFDPQTETFMNYHENDGLQSEEFNIGAYHKNGEGELFFGGINGLSRFHPNNVVKNNIPPKMVFTDFKIDNKSVSIGKKSRLEKNLNYVKELVIPYHINNFTFEYAALHYSSSEANQYAYKMVGFDEEWVYAEEKKHAHYTNLDPGEYTFIVKGSNSDGVWSDNVATVKIEITPPFWGTWTFRIISIWVFGGFIFLLVRLRIRQISVQKEMLEKQVNRRTEEVLNQKRQIEKQKDDLEKEKEKSERLLLNILPEQMVDELKIKGKARARNYQRVTVMFTDFKGFTQIAEKLRPSELVETLDSYFIKFDEIIAKYNVEKIKTIGDAYMCAGGIPIRNKSNPIEVVLAGLEIQEHVRQYNETRAKNGKKYWEVRLGVHTGEIIAGVIGIKRFAYDIWGDTVNVANRMEMSGEVGKVNISGKTYAHIKNFFECTYRGKVKAKNKGEFDMYFVDGIKPELSVDGLGKQPNEVFWDYVDLQLYSSINYMKAEKFIVKMLEKGLSDDLYYHNLEHMKDVCAAVERIGKGEGIKGEELFLLKTAALYHDAGFIEQYKDNEPLGVRMAREALPTYGYSEEQLNKIEELILATKVPQQPKNILEEVMCDADLDYLGRDDFHTISNELKKEFLAYGVVNNEKEWDELQISFLSAHKYFTKTARETRNVKKLQRLKEIKKRYAEDNYQEQEETKK